MKVWTVAVRTCIHAFEGVYVSTWKRVLGVRGLLYDKGGKGSSQR